MRISRSFLALALLGSLVASLGSAQAGAAQRGRLERGDSVFWTGPLVDQSQGDKKFTYKIEVAQRGYRLRVGLDKPEIGDAFTGRLYDPSGNLVDTFGPPINQYSAESVQYDPDRGVWKLVVEATEVTDSAFRVRAKLEASEPSLTGRRVLTPNLQILPPHDASFYTPISNGLQGGEPVYAEGGTGCHAEEHSEDGAVKCLRFSYGVRNTGQGPMDLSYTGSDPIERPLFQTLYRKDGSSFQREAGTAVFHKSHGHWHHSQAIGLRLYKVLKRRTGTIVAASDMRTKGFAHANELLRDWDRFYPTTMLNGFGLLPGWADIYEWDRPGNYIDFGLNGDGYYLVRMWADPVNGIRESNEQDNLGYAYLKVTGAEVKLIQVGRGRGPWDRCKIVMGFGGHPDPPRPKWRPRRCAPDTV